MKVLRNREVKQNLLFLCILDCSFIGAAFSLQPEFGILAAAFCLDFHGKLVFYDLAAVSAALGFGFGD